MQRVVLNMQSYIMGDAIKFALENGGDFNVTVVAKPEETARKCYSLAATAVIMEVTEIESWSMEERLKIRDEIKGRNENCKVVFLVNEKTEEALAEKVKEAKRDGLIDMFLYGSTSASFLTALIDTL